VGFAKKIAPERPKKNARSIGWVGVGKTNQEISKERDDSIKNVKKEVTDKKGGPNGKSRNLKGRL